MPDDLTFTPVGYEPMDAAWWPEVAAHIMKPWPRAAAMMDLRWWRGQEQATRKLRMKRVATMPGRPTLTERWGWTDWEVKKLLRAESDWSDDARSDSASVPPAFRQQPASETPADERSNAANDAESASVPPAFRQQPASETPRGRVDTVTPITVTPTQETFLAPATADAVIEPDPVVPQKPKRTTTRATKGKDKPPPHPFHQRVIDAWNRCWRNARPGTEYPWQTADVMQLVKKVRDPLVSREEPQATADMRRVGGAMLRYLSQRVDGTYVKGLSVRGFCGDVARWLTPVDTTPAPPRPGPSSAADRRRAALDMLDDALDRLNGNPDLNVIPANTPTEPPCLLLPAR